MSHLLDQCIIWKRSKNVIWRTIGSVCISIPVLYAKILKKQAAKTEMLAEMTREEEKQQLQRILQQLH